MRESELKPARLLQAGKFNMIPTLINMVAAFTSVGVVSFPAVISGTTAHTPFPRALTTVIYVPCMYVCRGQSCVTSYC